MKSPTEEKESHREAKDVATNEDFKCHEKYSKFLSAARQMMANNEFGKSLSYFAYIIHHAPQLSNEVHDDFLFALRSWCQVLEDHGKVEDLVKCLNEARKLFPNSAEISNYVGSALFRLNLFDEAAVYFRRALTLDPGLSGAQENLDSVANLLVERWHFRMLNDQFRNQAYKNAIDRAVKEGCDRVLDIGSGTGILSMFAVQSGAKNVYACEMSKTMFDLSADVIKSNGMEDSIHVINKRSYDLKIPDDLPERVSLIVTETLDCGLLGEGILEILTHAQRELMKSGEESNTDTRHQDLGKEHTDCKLITQVIPEGATVFGRIIQSEKIREYAQVKPKILDLDLRSVNIKGAEVSEKMEEPYTTEEISCIKHKTLSDPFQIMTYDFRTPEKYTQKSKLQIQVPVTNHGSVDAVMTWFELKLDSFETISSAPGHSVCWEQAVYPSRLGGGESEVEPGDEIMVDCKLTSCAIFLAIDHVIKGGSVVRSEELGQAYILPYPEISKLNDVISNQTYQTAITETYSEIKSTQGLLQESGNNGCLVLSNSPSFNPLFASASGFSPVLCISQEIDFTECLEVLRVDNGLPDTIQFTDCKLEKVPKCGQWGVLVVDPVEPSGVLRRGVVEDVVFAKGCVLAKDSGIVLPRKIEVWGMLISSDSLCRKSHVTGNDITLGLDIADHVNAFQVKNQVDVDVTGNPYVALTRPTRLLMLDFELTTSADDDESLLSLLQVTRDVHVTADKAGHVDGLMYWFRLEFSEERELSTGPESSSHFNQVVIVLKEKLMVSSGEELLVTSSCKNSCVTASVQRLLAG